MKYATKGKRLLAIVDAYSKVTGKTSYTMDEVAQWAVDKGLWPVPKRGDSPFLCEVWEEHFDAVVGALLVL